MKLEELNDKDTDLKILVYELKDNKSDNKNKIKYSKDIICPKCGENCLISIDDYKISLNQCSNGHEQKNILLNRFYDTQKIDESKIICSNCSKNILESYHSKIL